MRQYFFEMTDLFGEHLNYSWVHRFTIHANSKHSALIKLSRETGFNFRYTGVYYMAKMAQIAAYQIEEYNVNSLLESTSKHIK